MLQSLLLRLKKLIQLKMEKVISEGLGVYS